MNGARPRWREDAYHVATDDGAFILTHQGPVSMKGTAVRHWIDRLAPHLDGRHSLAELTASLDRERRAYVTKLVTTLLERGVVREVREDQPHGLTREEVAEHRGELDFIGYFTDSAAAAFERYRTGVVVVVGSGTLASAAVRAVLRTGSRLVRAALTPDSGADGRSDPEHAGRLERQVVSTDADLAALVAGAELVLYASDRPAPADAAGIDRLCAHHRIPVAHLVAVGGGVWTSPAGTPGLDAPAWSDGWRRLAALTPAGQSGSGIDGVVAQLAANQVAHNAFRHRVGLRPRPGPVLTRTDPDTTCTTRHRFLPHPFGDAAHVEDEEGFRRRVDALVRGPRLDPEEFSRRAVDLTDTELGVFGEITEADTPQTPLRISHTLVSDPVGLLGTTAARPRAVGVGLDFAEARHRTALRALAVYGSLMIDPRRLSTSAGAPLFAPDVDPGHALRPLRRGEAAGYVRAVDLADGHTPLVPATAAYPALIAPEARPVGVAAGYDWTEAVAAGLIAHCRHRTAEEALRSGQRFPLAECLVDDEETARLLSLVDATGAAVAIHDITGTLGVPTVACCLDDRTVAHGCGASPAAALTDGLRRTLFAVQTGSGREPAHTPVTAARRAVPELVRALRVRGRRVSAVPLDHDRRVHEVMPYLVHVVVTRDDD